MECDDRAEDGCYREILAGANREPIKYLGEPLTVHWDALQLGGEVSRVGNCEEQQHNEEEDVAQYAGEPAEQAAATPTSLLGLRLFTKSCSFSWLIPTDWRARPASCKKAWRWQAVALQRGCELDAGDDQNRKEPENDQVNRDEAEDHSQPGRQVVTGGQASYQVDSD